MTHIIICKITSPLPSRPPSPLLEYLFSESSKRPGGDLSWARRRHRLRRRLRFPPFTCTPEKRHTFLYIPVPRSNAVAR
ncbi:hypothetical protein EXIGLDRAFT_507263 [Exidia glandulosa HHB12029]|uniref:Uncharacterized protein n=1 Tax=Exidia glandulosa HHB12029 TaxID=1314781 RepID=A0A165PBI0_EXIGL|nr:hypothetical protein EXIGLDRAFT_507263 [Exidia glandulosa HHB12029]